MLYVIQTLNSCLLKIRSVSLKKKILPINVISSARVPVINLSDYDFDMEGLKLKILLI